MVKDSFSVPDDELVWMHLQEGKTAEELARMASETGRFIRLKLRHLGYYKNNIHPDRKELDIEHAIRLYKMGYSPNEMASFFKVNASTIRDRLRRLGIDMDYKTSVQYDKGKIAHHIKTEAILKKYGHRTKMKKADGGLFDW
jgi:hypothetical protein